ncbi:hypothetical protein DVW02_16525 [Clostridium botulinum]|nr:hypothetical protein [Clostridium botulinum]
MKNKILSLALAASLVAGIAIPSMAISISYNGEKSASISSPGTGEVGVKRSHDDDDQFTYGFSWINTDDNDLSVWTRVKIGSATFDKEYGYGYAQADQETYPGAQTVSELHGGGR